MSERVGWLVLYVLAWVIFLVALIPMSTERALGVVVALVLFHVSNRGIERSRNPTRGDTDG